jgi:hypothetical protein
VTPQRWALNVLKAGDVALNVVLLFDSRVQTLSRRAGLARNKGKRWGCVLCRVLEWFAPKHCDRAVEAGEVV